MRVVGRRIADAVGKVGLVAVLAVPLALAWGVGTAHTTDYLGPHRSTFDLSYDAQVRVDLGPLGEAYLPRHFGPVGLDIHVGALGPLEGGTVAGLGEQTLSAYTNLYADPTESIRGVIDELVTSAAVRSLAAELVLVALGVAWRYRGRILTVHGLELTRTRRGLLAYAAVTCLLAGSILAPPPDSSELRYPITATDDDRLVGLTVDNLVLADLLNRGLSGVRLLADRQLAAVDSYVATAKNDLAAQQNRWPAARSGESMIFAISDLHCNQAMTRLYTTVVGQTRPAVVVSAGDDTVNGSAAERGCITREAAIAAAVPQPDGSTAAVPFVVASGNHDSGVTDAQEARAGMLTLDGQVVSAAGLDFLGDDDPELQVPFSIDRTQQRPESEEQMAARLLGVAAGRDRPVDVMVVHQPNAALPMIAGADPPMRLLIWGHMHAQLGPRVIQHADGSWTVAMQLGTAGGVAQQTLTALSTPISPPRTRADAYVVFRDDATGLVTAIQPIHFGTDGSVVIDDRIVTGNPADLPAATRRKLGATSSPSPAVSESGGER